jgi:hypothetical protein
MAFPGRIVPCAVDIARTLAQVFGAFGDLAGKLYSRSFSKLNRGVFCFEIYEDSQFCKS